MLRRTTGCVITAVALLAAWFAGPWLSAYLLTTWLGISDRLDIAGDTYGRYWQARELPGYQGYFWQIVLSGLIGFGAPLLAAAGLSWRLLRRRRHPIAHVAKPLFAKRCDVQKAGMLGGVGLIVGSSPRWGELRLKRQGHVLLCTPSHENAEAFLIANLLDTPGSVVVLDNDARLWRATSGYRKQLGELRLLRPFAADGRTSGWNPLARLSGDAYRRRSELSAIASMLYDDTHYGARSMGDVKDAFVAFASYAYDDAMVLRALGGDASAVSPTFSAILQLVASARSGGKATVYKMLTKSFIDGDTRSMLGALLRLTRRTFTEQISTLEPVLLAFREMGVSTATRGGNPLDALPDGSVVSIYVAIHDELSRSQKRLAAVLVWDVIRAMGSRQSTPATVMLDGIERIGAINGLSDTLRGAGKGGMRVVLGTRQPARWRDVYGYAGFAALVDATACRVVQAPPDRAAENDYLGLVCFSSESRRGRVVAYDSERASQLATDLTALRSNQQLLIAEVLPGPLICAPPTPLRDRRLSSRLLPPVTVDPAAPGDPDMPHPTLRAIGATAALAFAVGATTACTQDKASRAEQDLAEQAKKDGLTVDQERSLKGVMGAPDAAHRPPPYSEKLVAAKLGPNTFQFPMNLYDNQTGPDFQGSVGLLLDWPSLEPFAPGYVAKEGANDEVTKSGIIIGLSYLAKASADKVFQDSIKPKSYNDPADPRNSLSARRRGNPIYGLDVYYIDAEKLSAFLQRRGNAVQSDRVLELSEDWYVRFTPRGALATLIVCTTTKIAGATLVEGKLKDTSPGTARAICRHTFIVPEENLMVDISYLRAYLQDWQKIEDAARKRIAAARIQ